MAKQNCDKDCMTCALEQRSYCAVKMSIANQEMLMALTAKIDALAVTGKTELISPIISEPTVPGAETINDE